MSRVARAPFNDSNEQAWGMQRVYSNAQEFDVPVLLHFEHETYNAGFERFYKMLEKFPGVNFIGHAPGWWGNIDLHHDQQTSYPRAPVTRGGISDRLLSDYPNSHSEGAPFHHYGKLQSTEAIGYAREIIDFVTDQMAR